MTPHLKKSSWHAEAVYKFSRFYRNMHLTMFVAETLGPEYELWLTFGTGKYLRHLAAHKNSHWARTKKGPGTSNVSCPHRLWHCVQGMVRRHLECTATTQWCIVHIVMCTKWHAERCYAYHWDVCHPAVWQTLQIPPTRAAACKESNLPGRSRMGPITASNSCTACWGWMKAEDGLYESNWTRLPGPAPPVRLVRFWP